jgi:multicomponent K+:H+ antiporter subunit G
MTALTLSAWVVIPSALLLMLGGIFALNGVFGLLRLKSFYACMHAPTMGATPGAACVLAAST